MSYFEIFGIACGALALVHPLAFAIYAINAAVVERAQVDTQSYLAANVQAECWASDYHRELQSLAVTKRSAEVVRLRLEPQTAPLEQLK